MTKLTIQDFDGDLAEYQHYIELRSILEDIQLQKNKSQAESFIEEGRSNPLADGEQ